MSATDFSMKPRIGRRGAVIGVLVAAVLAGIALDTRVVAIGSAEDTRTAAFNPDNFGRTEFPKIVTYVKEHAVDAATLAQALAADKKAAAQKYGAGGVMPVLPVSLQGTVGEGKAGIYSVDVPGADGVTIRVQTGPAINGTDLRDATGQIAFGDFKNQIEYQDAASGINRAMKAGVLDKIDTADLTGRTIRVTGVFKLINPKMWLITPVEVSVK